MIEEWRDVVGYEGLYQVSNLGRVKSLPKMRGFVLQESKMEKKEIVYSLLTKNISLSIY